jgi:hypothetical protein
MELAATPATTINPTITPPATFWNIPKAPTIAAVTTPRPTFSTGTTATEWAALEESVSPAPKKRRFKHSVDDADAASWAGPRER